MSNENADLILGMKRALDIINTAEGDIDFARWAIEKDIEDLSKPDAEDGK